MSPARTTDPAAIDSPSLLLGEVRGQLRELIHTMNNTAMKVDALAKDVGSLAKVPEQVADNRAQIAALAARVNALESERDERRGATSVIGTILKSPALGWLVGAAITAWAILTGRVHA